MEPSAQPQPPGGGSPSKRSAWRWRPWAVLSLALGAAAVAVGASVIVAVCVVALAGAATALGWHLGESRRSALADEIEGRSTELKRALSELEIAQAETVRRLSMAVEFRDEGTGAHIERIGRFSTLLAEQIGMDADFCERLSHAAPLHDVGKVAIPDAILLKPGPLTVEERAIVETHAEEGYRLVRGSSSSILDMAATIALSHQEKWDGTGYPRGLAGESIPIEGRIVAVVDVFDALTSDRVYRKAFPVDEATRMMRDQRGRHFDPVLLDAFMEVLGSSGPDAREHVRADPSAIVESTLEIYSTALERGDAETAEGAIATAIEDGIPPTMLHGEVIAPALRRIGELWAAGEIDIERKVLASGIARRVLATLYRYMLGGTEATRERILLAGVEGDEQTLGLQMMHDQLAAAGYRTILDTDLSVERMRSSVDSQAPDLVVLGSTPRASADAIEQAVKDLRAAHPDIPIVFGGIAAGGGLPRELEGVRVLERMDESVGVVEELLAARAPAASV
jgi:HD-GYP domain-containing protein (c-di-GMP phosphodiesterase class II)/methylmalonyl-CoA mutase cobalamin-binding subunit